MSANSRSVKFESSLIRYYFLSAIVESIIALVALLVIPGDPKNAHLLGYSTSRWLLVISLVLILAFFSFIYTKGMASNRWLRVFDWIDKKINGGSIFICWLVFGIVTLLLTPYIYMSFNLYRYVEISARLSPFLFLLLTRALQTILVLTIYYFHRKQLNIPPHQKKFTDMITPVQLGVSTGLVILLLQSANIWGYFLRKIFWNNVNYDYVQRYYLQFNVDQEFNIPAYFSFFILLLAGIILLTITAQKFQAKDKFTYSWMILAFIFIFLAFDEVLTLHEKLAIVLDERFHPVGIFGFFPWLIVAFPFVILLGIVYYKFIISLPMRTRQMMILAASIYIGGAIGLEMAGGWYAINFGVNKDMRFVLYTLEEIFEMSGVMLFNYTLLDYAQKNPVSLPQELAQV